jgi:hypothetical protein
VSEREKRSETVRGAIIEMKEKLEARRKKSPPG